MSGVRVGNDSRARRDGIELDKSEINGGEVDCSEIGDDEGGKKCLSQKFV